MLSQKLNASDIQALGLATRMVDDDKLMEEGLAFAQQLAAGPTVAYAGVKRNIVDSCTRELKEYLRTESVNQVACTFTKDIREAGKAFIEKRAPVFKGE